MHEYYEKFNNSNFIFSFELQKLIEKNEPYFNGLV